MRFLLRSLKFVVVFLASTVCFAAQADRIAGPIGTGPAVALAKSLHPKAQPQYDQGAVDPSFKLSYMTMFLAPSAAQQRDLDQLLADQQDRTSASYHKWLTPQQFADRFGLSHNDLNKVTAWLEGQGFEILSVGGGRNAVNFSGTAAQVQRAFGTEIHNYKVGEETHFANSGPLMVPAALSGVVRTVLGVHSFLPRPASRRRVSGTGKASHPHYYDANFLWPNFLAPGDIATIYDITPLYSASIDGTGQKLAIVGQTDIYLADVNDFRSGFGLSTISGCTTSTSGLVTACDSTNFKYVLVGSDPGVASACGDLGEADLDIEWSGATARNAQIVYVNSPVTFNSACTSGTGGGVNAALNAVINPPSGPPLAPVVSMSYGDCEAQAGDIETVLQQGNAEGVTITNSSGDLGAATCDYNPTNSKPPYSAAVGGLAVSYPASSPEVTGVGGTEISIADDSGPPANYWSTTVGVNGGTARTYIPEVAWNDDVIFGQFCAANAGISQYASLCSPSPGVEITSQETFQEDWWISSGGGGASNCFTESGTTCLAGFSQPTWQNVTVSGAPSGVRYVPDVSLMSSPNFPGYVFCTPQNPPTTTTSTCVNGVFDAVDTYQSIVGGTSASSPIFAGIVTLLNQYLGGSGLGNINPTLYELAKTPSNGAFHPITSGNNTVYCQGGTHTGSPVSGACPGTAGTIATIGYDASNFDAATSYNLVAGLGSVDANALATAIAPPDFQLTASALNPASVPAGQTTAATLTISAISGSTGMVVNFSPSSCSGLPSGATCSFSPQAVTFDGTNSATTTVTISTLANMASGPTTVTITPTNSPQTTATVSLTVGATNQSFTLTTTASTFPVTVGGTATINVAVTGGGSPINFVANSVTALPITYTCTASPSLSTAEISCQVSPGNGQPTSATAVTVSLVTTPKTNAARPVGGGGIAYLMLVPGMFGILFAAGSRKRAVRLLSLVVVLGVSTMWMGACGGSSSNTQSNPGTPAGTYAVTINATTGGANPLTATLPITLTVSQ